MSGGLLRAGQALTELLPHHRLDGAVELALEAGRRLLARLPEALVEGEHRDLGMPLDLALGDPLEPVGLSTLPLGKNDLEPAADVGLGALERVGDRRLARTQPLRDLVDRAPALERVGLQLVERLRHSLTGGTLELLAEPDDRAALLVGGGAELCRLRLEPCLDLRDRVPVALLEMLELRLEVSLRAFEIGRKAPQTLVEAPLGLDDLLGECRARALRALGEPGTPLLGEPPLLRLEQRHGVGALAREDAPDLLRVGSGLGGRGLLHRMPRLRDETRRGRRVGAGASQRNHEPDGDDDRGHEAAGEDPREHACRVRSGAVGLAEDLERIARAAGATGPICGVLATAPTVGSRIYVCAFGADGEPQTWLALDDDARSVHDRRLVRDAVSIAALCEVAEEAAFPGDLDELRAQLVALRISEAPEGIEEAEAAARELQHVLGAPPHVASVRRLDEIGAAARRLETALDPTASSPFTIAMRSAVAVADALWADVESSYRDALD